MTARLSHKVSHLQSSPPAYFYGHNFILLEMGNFFQLLILTKRISAVYCFTFCSLQWHTQIFLYNRLEPTPSVTKFSSPRLKSPLTLCDGEQETPPVPMHCLC